MQNFVGKQVDRYRITARLGMGGMAVVYKAYDTRLERDVALKLIRADAIPSEQYGQLMARFEREAKSQARFDHKHIVHIYDYGDVNGSPYLVMACINGGSLKQRMSGPVRWQQAVRWMIPVAEALSYAHQRGVVHRDVKPGNILFDEDGQPVLTDFGIAKILESDDLNLTATGLGVGTPAYMAPEQWQGQTSPATDQYALGVVLYELVTGQKPYQADTPAAVILKQATEPLKPPSRLVRDLPEGLEKVITQALALDPHDRYSDMQVLQNALENLLAEVDEGEVRAYDVARKISGPKPGVRKPVRQKTANIKTFVPEIYRRQGNSWELANPEKKKNDRWLLWSGGVFGVILFIGLIIGLWSSMSRSRYGSEALQAMFPTQTPSMVNTDLLFEETGEIIRTEPSTLTPIPEAAIIPEVTDINTMKGPVQGYRFTVSEFEVEAYIEDDGSLSINYLIEFQNNPNADPIDFVDIGMPNPSYNIDDIEARVGGTPITDIESSPYVDNGFALGLGANAIQPGKTAIISIWLPGVDMFRLPFSESESGALYSFQFSPTWFDPNVDQSTSTKYRMTIILPNGVGNEEGIYYNPQNWPGTDEPNDIGRTNIKNDEYYSDRIYYSWFSNSANAHTQYTFRVSFSVK